MPKLNYLLKVVNGASFEKLNHCIDVVHQRSGKAKAAIFADMTHCMLKYGAGYFDYMIFEYENMNAAQRATYMTRMVNKKMTMMLNDQSYTHIFDYKNEFYHTFKDFLKRDFLDLALANKEEVEKFIEGKEFVIAKPSDGECGKGIKKNQTAGIRFEFRSCGLHSGQSKQFRSGGGLYSSAPRDESPLSGLGQLPQNGNGCGERRSAPALCRAENRQQRKFCGQP